MRPVAVTAMDEQWQQTRYQADSDLVFCHVLLGTPLDPSNLSKRYLRPALRRAGIEGVTGFHSLRHTALTAAAATGLGPHYVQALAGHVGYDRRAVRAHRYRRVPRRRGQDGGQVVHRGHGRRPRWGRKRMKKSTKTQVIR
jgi:integrase